MTTREWTWANLNEQQVQLMTQAEASLGADYLLVYTPTDHVDPTVEPQVRDLKAAPLTESQLECLHGLESQMGAVIVAYANPEE